MTLYYRLRLTVIAIVTSLSEVQAHGGEVVRKMFSWKVLPDGSLLGARCSDSLIQQSCNEHSCEEAQNESEDIRAQKFEEILATTAQCCKKIQGIFW